MIDTLKIFAAFALGYLLGSLNSAVIVGRLYGKNISSHGSESAGLTNTLRVLGKSAALFVLVGDISKGIVACLIGLRLGVYIGSGAAKDRMSLLAAGAGKGALAAVTVLFMVDWVMALICLGFFVMIVASTRYVSLGTIGAVMLFVVMSLVPIFGASAHFQIFAGLMAAIIIFKHRENIKRLISGAENKLAF